MYNIENLTEGLRVCISVRSLFDYLTEDKTEKNVDYSNGFIEKTFGNRKMDYELYNNMHELACMDGEICFVNKVNKQNDSATLINRNGEYPVAFELYAEEIEEALFINIADID